METSHYSSNNLFLLLKPQRPALLRIRYHFCYQQKRTESEPNNYLLGAAISESPPKVMILVLMVSSEDPPKLSHRIHQVIATKHQGRHPSPHLTGVESDP